MKHRALDEGITGDAFTDLLFNALLGFAMMFIIAFMLIEEPVEAGDIDVKAEMLITATWPDGHPDDVDMLVEGPRGEVVWYHNRDGDLMHLDRDDRGLLQRRCSVFCASVGASFRPYRSTPHFRHLPVGWRGIPLSAGGVR